MTEYGTKPAFKDGSWVQVGDTYNYAKDEYGKFTKAKFSWYTNVAGKPTFGDFWSNFLKGMAGKGATVLYAKYTYTVRQYRDREQYHVEITECIYKGSPIAPIIIVALIAATAVIVWLFMPIFYKWAGVSPAEVFAYRIGDIGTLAMIGILLFIILMIWRR